MYTQHNIKTIVHISGLDHPESIAIGPGGEAYTTGTGGQVYRINLEKNVGEQFASTAPRRVLGQCVDAEGNLYCADCTDGKMVRISPDGRESIYATGPGGRRFLCANYPAFDRHGNLYLSDSGDWSDAVNGAIYRIAPGGGQAELWYPQAVDTPNAIALDEEERYLYFVETHGSAIARIAIMPDGSAGKFERIVHLPFLAPDGIAFDTAGRIWIGCHRPDAIYIFDPGTRRLELFAEDWTGEHLRGPTDVAFAGLRRDILLAASLDGLRGFRWNNVGATGLRLNHPKL
jgi:sugar lactone lactonase YvrE